MHETAEILDVVGSIYDAACNPDGWSTVLEKVAKLTGSSSAALIFRDETYPRANFVYSHGIALETFQAYLEHYINLDPFFKLLAKALPRCSVSADHLLLPDREALRNECVEFYDGFMIPHDIYHIGGAGLMVDGDRMGAIAIQRRQKLGPWSDEELEKLGMLTRHFQRAFYIHREFIRLRTHEYAVYAMFDQLVIGLVLLDARHRVFYANPAAKSILDTHPTLKIHKQCLFATELEDRKRISTLIQGAIDGNSGDATAMRGGVLSLRHANCDFPLLLAALPVTDLQSALQDTGGEGCVALFLSDPERNPPISVEALQETFELTRAEAEVAISLVNGLTPKEIAEKKNVSPDTVRAQLKSVYRKTATASQAELVRLLLTGPLSTVCI